MRCILVIIGRISSNELKCNYLKNYALRFKSTSNFEHFESNDEPHSLISSVILNCQKGPVSELPSVVKHY